MPTSSSSETRLSEEAVRAAVMRLSRPDRDGGTVIERAAILAEGTPAAAIEAWVISHGGQPEERGLAAPASGLYGLRADPHTRADGRPPRRYLLPATTFDPQRAHDGIVAARCEALAGPGDAGLGRS
jgi:hypothetical protein